jgi:hypothetical protein
MAVISVLVVWSVQRQHWVQALRNAGLIKARHVDTELNLADIFTEALQGRAFRLQRDSFLHDCKYICIRGKIDIIKINHDQKGWLLIMEASYEEQHEYAQGGATIRNKNKKGGYLTSSDEYIWQTKRMIDGVRGGECESKYMVG